jgi:16S rRNA (adenine1518-N6/adenine1519-N6)-dimethyltransferase
MELIQFLRVNEIWAKRTMGQNFLVDNEVLAKIIAAADISPTDTILEIGPGLGVLTEELAKVAGKVVAVEKDDHLAQALKSKIQNPNVKILNQDALEFDPNGILRFAQNDKKILKQVQDDPSTGSGQAKYKLVANIPYNITSLIIRKFLEAENKPELMVLMVQKEVAERITAKPGDMSLLAVSVQFYADAEIVDIVSASAFFPVPKVDSAIIKIVPTAPRPEIDEKEFFRIVKFGFAAKRKTLENNLAAGLHISKIEASDIIKKTGLEEKIRAESLSIENWITLYQVVRTEAR